MVSLPTSSSESCQSSSWWSGTNCSMPSPLGEYYDRKGVYPDHCHCGLLLQVQTSMTPHNPFRRFKKFPRKTGLNDGYEMFFWIDKEYTDETRDVINDLYDAKRNLQATVSFLKRSLLEKEIELQKLRAKFAEVEVKQHECLYVTAREKLKMKLYLKFHTLVVVVVMLLVVLLLVK